MFSDLQSQGSVSVPMGVAGGAAVSMSTVVDQCLPGFCLSRSLVSSAFVSFDSRLRHEFCSSECCITEVLAVCPV